MFVLYFDYECLTLLKPFVLPLTIKNSLPSPTKAPNQVLLTGGPKWDIQKSLLGLLVGIIAHEQVIPSCEGLVSWADYLNKV